MFNADVYVERRKRLGRQVQPRQISDRIQAGAAPATQPQAPARAMVKQHSQLMLSLLRLSDVVAAAAAWTVVYCAAPLTVRLGLWRYDVPELPDMAPWAALSIATAMLAFIRLGLYEPKRTRSLMVESANVVKAVAVAWIATFVIMTLVDDGRLSREAMAAVGAVWLVLAVACRMFARAALRWFRSHGWNLRYAAIVGCGRLGQELYHVLKRNKWTGIVTRYFVDNPRGGAGDLPSLNPAGGRKLLGLDVLGPTSAIDEILARSPVDTVFVALPGSRYDEVEQVLNRLARTNADVQVVPDLLSFHFLKHDITQLDELPVITLTYSPQHGWNSVVKRAFDIVGAVAGLIVLAIPMAAIALGVKLTSRGPALYRQKRTSLGGEPFDILKFRTMAPNAEDETGPTWASPNDPRATGFGRFLRRTSLDELPQLFNVLLGEMSLVGPRPERPELIARFREKIPRYMLRHQVKAGLTGWAQVHGLRGQTSLRKRVQYDLYYIANWSLGMDLRVLFLSLLRGAIHPNAY